MDVERTGLILYVKEYFECVEFYSKVLNLPIQFQNNDLTCFDFYGTYLMIEKEDRDEYLNDNTKNKNYSCIRINVEYVKGHLEVLKKHNIVFDYKEHSWGTIAKFKDPEGNLIAFKDEKNFAKQIEDFKNKTN